MNETQPNSTPLNKVGLIGFSFLYVAWMLFLGYLAITLSGQ